MTGNPAAIASMITVGRLSIPPCASTTLGNTKTFAVARRCRSSRCGLAPDSVTRSCRFSFSICARCIHELIKSNLERSRHKNVVGVRGKAKRDWKKSVNPESGPRRHSRKVRVNVPNPQFLQAQPDVNSLIEPKKIRAPGPFIESSHDIRREFSLFPSAANIIQQFLLLR